MGERDYIHSVILPSPLATDWVRETVGQRYKGPDRKVFFCDSYDSRWGFWMTEETDHTNRRNVSVRAIGGVYRRIDL